MDTEASRERAGAVDRLSELPDCVLQDAILSHLTTRQAARTSVLSRRWRHLWRGVPCVDIDHCEFPRPPDIDRRADLDEFRRVSEDRIRRDMRQRVTFRDVVDAMLPSQSLRDAAAAPPPPLDAVRLRLSRLDFHAAWAWIRRGLERRPVAFHLRFDDDPLAFNEDDDPLAYYVDRHVGFPDLLFFPNDGAHTSRLRTLHLARMRLGDGLADALATDFPVLEDLQLQDCRYAFRYLVSRSLKKLSMDKCGAEYGVNRLVLELPRIASLWIHRSSLPITMEDGMPSFATVFLTFTNDRSALDLLRSLRGARSLNLSQFSMMAWLDDDDEEWPGGLPVFRNLRTLLLDVCDVGVECQVLRHFLRNAPCLETLKLRNCVFFGGSRRRKRKARSSSERRGRTGYRCKNLKSVELEFNEGHIVLELADALGDISKEAVQPIESSVRDGKRKVKILYK